MDNVENQIAPEDVAPVPADAQLIVSVMTPEHRSIGRDFLDRTSFMLRQEGVKIKKYSIEESDNVYFPDVENICLEIDDRTTLSISLQRKIK